LKLTEPVSPKLHEQRRRMLDRAFHLTTLTHCFSSRAVETLKRPAASSQLPADLSAASRRASLSSLGSRSASAGSWTREAGNHLVENTGLEPVTSWLQTRRSPS
jgi:hypothetical protein